MDIDPKVRTQISRFAGIDDTNEDWFRRCLCNKAARIMLPQPFPNAMICVLPDVASPWIVEDAFNDPNFSI
jgi:hypothetical protein